MLLLSSTQNLLRRLGWINCINSSSSGPFPIPRRRRKPSKTIATRIERITHVCTFFINLRFQVEFFRTVLLQLWEFSSRASFYTIRKIFVSLICEKSLNLSLPVVQCLIWRDAVSGVVRGRWSPRWLTTQQKPTVAFYYR